MAFPEAMSPFFRLKPFKPGGSNRARDLVFRSPDSRCRGKVGKCFQWMGMQILITHKGHGVAFQIQPTANIAVPRAGTFGQGHRQAPSDAGEYMVFAADVRDGLSDLNIQVVGIRHRDVERVAGQIENRAYMFGGKEPWPRRCPARSIVHLDQHRSARIDCPLRVDTGEEVLHLVRQQIGRRGGRFRIEKSAALEPVRAISNVVDRNRRPLLPQEVLEKKPDPGISRLGVARD